METDMTDGERLSEGDKYRAFRNMMFNELGITKADIRTWVLEAVREQVARVEIEQRVENAVEATIAREVQLAVKDTLGVNRYPRSSAVVERAIAAMLRDRLRVTITEPAGDET